MDLIVEYPATNSRATMPPMLEAVGWRDLPFRGEVRELKIVGNGKNCFLQVWVPNGSAFTIPLSGARACMTCSDGVFVETRALDDVSLEILYRPAPGHRMRIVDAKVNYPGSETDWASDCKIWGEMSRAKWPRESSWAVSAINVTLSTRFDTDAKEC